MVKLRPDWCLSRQRYWGVPIPAVICNICHEEILDVKIIKNFADIVAQVGTDSWFKRVISDFLPKGFHCPHCRHSDFSKGLDILDVWFDSGVSAQAVLKKRKELAYPCALYLEGSDQHRGWFQSSLIPSMCIDGIPPFKSVLTHGFVVDGKGQKMSKSLGNVISPLDIIKDYGADILRLWVASSDYNEDIRISPEILARLAEAYRKVRNTIRFILSNLYDFNPDTDKVDYRHLERIDKWVLFRLQNVLNAAEEAYGHFEFYKAYKGVYDFCNVDLSMYYLDMVKGRLYTYAGDSQERRAAQTAIYGVLDVLVRMIAPMLSFSAEEAWQHMPKEKRFSGIRSVHLLDWPEGKPIFKDDDLEILGLIPEVAKLLEEKRGKGVIGSPFDAQIILLTNNEIRYKYVESLRGDLAEIFKVSRVSIERVQRLDKGRVSDKFPDIAIIASHADGTKCVRCWNYSDSVGKDKVHSLICDRCLKAIGGNQIEEEI